MSYSELGQYKFVSMDQNHLVGSIYYERGRIRLVHSHGPTVALLKRNDYVAYFVLPNWVEYPKDYFENWNFLNIYEAICIKGGRLLNLTNSNIRQHAKIVDPNTIWFIGIDSCYGNCYLFEIYLQEKDGLYICTRDHSSRGFPSKANISDIQRDCYKDIFHYAEVSKNENNPTRYNFIVCGCFYGWYKLYQQNPPFNIHSPYEESIYKPLK